MNELIYEVFIDLERQGPGSKETTLKALKCISELKDNITLIDIGCGTGTQTLFLAEALNGKIIGLDNYEPFLDILINRAKDMGLGDKVDVIEGDMAKLNFKNEEFDIIWSEGALYHIGFKKALKEWRKFIKPGGYFVASDFNWFTPEPPKEVYDYMDGEVPYDTTIDEALIAINNKGYELINHFKIPEKDWFDFYEPMEEKLLVLKEKYKDNKEALDLLNSFQYEADLYRKYKESYGYVFYVLRKS